jgi:hypothetical protein
LKRGKFGKNVIKRVQIGKNGIKRVIVPSNVVTKGIPHLRGLTFNRERDPPKFDLGSANKPFGIANQETSEQ